MSQSTNLHILCGPEVAYSNLAALINSIGLNFKIRGRLNRNRDDLIDPF